MLEKIGKYEIRLQIGRGAMGTVYEGFDPAIGRRVAIKTLRTEMFEARHMPDVLTRFKREAQSAGRLSHPHIVTIHEYGEHEGTAYIVMEYIKGSELGHELNRGVRFSIEDTVRIMTQLLGALANAHENKVVHRDLKPANMFVLEDGSLKVVDFGIAHVEASDLTDTGAMLGTPAYMSPEQCLGTQVDHRSDLFSAGVILYQLLTGDKPFTGSVTTIIQKVLRQEPIAPSELNPTLSPAWDKVVARAMAKKPEARYESARQFAEAIKAAHSSDRAHEGEVRRKVAEAEEHVQRTAEERSRAESLRRAEDEWREAEERAVVLTKPRSSRATGIVAAAVALLGIIVAVLYYRQGAEDKVPKPDAVKKVDKADQTVRLPGTVFQDCADCPSMVVIPAGEYMMGSPASEAGRKDYEGPQHRVVIQRPFAAGRYEVTFNEWDHCVRENGCSRTPEDEGLGRGLRPVINVSWREAKQYAEWLSRKTGKHYRLLTESEWEYAARAGTTTAYNTGAEIKLSQGSFSGRPVPVGSYPPNAFGLYDVHGNVWEWTEDCWHTSYAVAPSDGSAWLTGGDHGDSAGNCWRRVIRGGGWEGTGVRSAVRDVAIAERGAPFIGFRLARTLE